MRTVTWRGSLAAVLVAASAVTVGAQIGGKPVIGGNPTPGTPQPAPPNLDDRIALTGCLQTASGAGAAVTHDVNTPSDARFVVIKAERVNRVPPGTGGSELAAAASGLTYRLDGIDSLFSPFVGTRVEISGEVKPSPDGAVPALPPILLVEFVQKIAATCTG